MSHSRIAAVTGANKGIGYAIVRNMALAYPKSPMNNGPLLIYLTARDKSRGEAAVQSLASDAQLKSAKALAADGGLTDVRYLPLDVSSEESVKAFESALKKQHPEGIDIFVNNAGIALDGFNADLVRQTLRCNYYGALDLTQTMLPHLRAGGRLVNVSSAVGKLGKYPEPVRDRFRNASGVEQVTGLMQAFQDSVDKGTHAKDGWPTSGYAVSKSGVTAFSRVLARQAAEQGRGVLLNSCCPGYVSTDMSKFRGRKTPDQGAATPVKLALGDINGVNGEFWEHEDVSDW